VAAVWALFWASYTRPTKIVKDRDKMEKKKLLVNKSGLFRSRKYTKMTDPITKNTPFMTARQMGSLLTEYSLRTPISGVLPALEDEGSSSFG
jgi:hypothetical protein